MKSSNRLNLCAFVVLGSLSVLPGCATKKYVRQEVAAQVSDAVTRLEAADKKLGLDISDVKERTDAVDKKAMQGIADAKAASSSAAAASAAAGVADEKAITAQAAASTADTKAVGAQSSANQAQSAATTANAAAQTADRNAGNAQTAATTAQRGVSENTTRIAALENKVVNVDTLDSYAPSGPALSINFAFDSDALSAEAKKTLDTIAGEVSGLRAGFMIELQGFTDSVGADLYNIDLSQRRAQAVERYLVSKGVPLFRISIVGLGKDNPVGDNKNAAGQAQNRRVEVRLLRANSNPVK